MFETAIKAAAAMTGILTAWLLVQAAWGRVFAHSAEHTARAGWKCNDCQDATKCELSMPAADCAPQTEKQEDGESLMRKT